jgi:hypothetical protein
MVESLKLRPTSNAAVLALTAALPSLAHGDFNARVDFNLVDWPAENGTSLNLAVAGTPYNVYRVSWQFDPGVLHGPLN